MLDGIIFALQTSPVCYTLTGTKLLQHKVSLILAKAVVYARAQWIIFAKAGLLFSTLAFDKRHVVDRQPPAVSSSYSLK